MRRAALETALQQKASEREQAEQELSRLAGEEQRLASQLPEAEQAAGHGATPQRTWWEEKALANRFACEVAALIRVYEVLSGA